MEKLGNKLGFKTEMERPNGIIFEIPERHQKRS